MLLSFFAYIIYPPINIVKRLNEVFSIFFKFFFFRGSGSTRSPGKDYYLTVQ